MSDLSELFENGYHPVFSTEDGSLLMSPGDIYKIYFRGGHARTFMVTDGSNKPIITGDNLLFLKSELLLSTDYSNAALGISANKTRFFFLFEEKVVFFETTNRFKDLQPVNTYMIFFKKVM